MMVLLIGLSMFSVIGYTSLKSFMKKNSLIRLSHSKKHLELPTYCYKNSTTGKSVTLVGVMHVADQSYFTHLQKILHSYESNDFRILYEMVNQPSDEDLESFSDNEKEIYKRFKQIGPMMKALAEHMGLAYQKDELTYSNKWINTDINMTNLVRAAIKNNIKVPDIQGYQKEINKFIKLDSSKNTLLKQMLMFLPLLMKWQKLSNKILHRKTLSQDIILDYRNDIAFKGIKTHLEKVDNIVSIWGVGHLPGIEKMLLNEGFERATENWTSAITFR